MEKTTVPLLCGALLLSGCRKTAGTAENAVIPAANAAPVTVIDTAALFSERDLDGSYDETAAVRIRLEGETAVCDSDAIYSKNADKVFLTLSSGDDAGGAASPAGGQGPPPGRRPLPDLKQQGTQRHCSVRLAPFDPAIPFRSPPAGHTVQLLN